MRLGRGCACQVVHVHGLHETESRHHQHEEQRRPFLDQGAAELGVLLHSESGRSCTV